MLTINGGGGTGKRLGRRGGKEEGTGSRKEKKKEEEVGRGKGTEGGVGAKETLESQSIDINATSTTMIFYFLGGNCLSEYLMGRGLINYRKSSVTFSFLLNIDTSLATTWSFFLESGWMGDMDLHLPSQLWVWKNLSPGVSEPGLLGQCHPSPSYRLYSDQGEKKFFQQQHPGWRVG